MWFWAGGKVVAQIYKERQRSNACEQTKAEVGDPRAGEEHIPEASARTIYGAASGMEGDGSRQHRPHDAAGVGLPFVRRRAYWQEIGGRIKCRLMRS